MKPADPLTHVCRACLGTLPHAYECRVPMRCRVCRRRRFDVVVVRESVLSLLNGDREVAHV